MDRIQIKRNAPVALLYEDAIRNEGAIISSSGALINFSGKKTGRSPKDKRIVYEDSSKDDIWWGSVNIKMDERMIRSDFYQFSHLLFIPDTFEINRERAIDYLNTRDNVYVFDGYAGVSSSISHLCQYSVLNSDSGILNTGSKFVLFAPELTTLCSWYILISFHHEVLNDLLFLQHNMLIRPTEEQLATFGDPEFIIYNAGQFPANRFTKGMSSTTSVEINFKRMEMVILGTEYAGEMKKGVFSVMVCFRDPISR